MKTGAKLAAATAILMSLGGATLAAGDHGQGAPGAQGPRAGNHDMMQVMMRMHAQMMGGMGMMGPGGPMSGMGQGMGMMGGGPSLMGMAMERFDTDGDGTVASQETREGLQALLTEYDADGDEALSLAEFETLHSALIRETMVDRFQFLDADGDGAVSVAEIVKPADMMERMETMRDGMMPGPNGGMQGDGGMMGTPGQGRMGNN
ncbi:EF-hand domain-containing protein [Palleronia pelagia]|uniref:Ca2+-binding protein, EF-hand superfamily n=1 Tax=Palleronia pelagia TaxID=387096 RepID=A0A1H8MBC8_9RHOB|nr:calcium-binding protein [Palleronia pelagia]SEO14677.1 Ca2+-binding protein, EF-hand superfamily [Palleronia pelagia]